MTTLSYWVPFAIVFVVSLVVLRAFVRWFWTNHN